MIELGLLTSSLFSAYNHHQDADLKPGLTLDDLRRVYHGLDKDVTSETRLRFPSNMEKMVRPGGEMRSHLEDGCEAAERALMSCLEGGSKETDFARTGLVQPDDPSPQQVIAAHCVRCRNAADGEESDRQVRS